MNVGQVGSFACAESFVRTLLVGVDEMLVQARTQASLADPSIAFAGKPLELVHDFSPATACLLASHS